MFATYTLSTSTLWQYFSTKSQLLALLIATLWLAEIRTPTLTFFVTSVTLTTLWRFGFLLLFPVYKASMVAPQLGLSKLKGKVFICLWLSSFDSFPSARNLKFQLLSPPCQASGNIVRTPLLLLSFRAVFPDPGAKLKPFVLILGTRHHFVLPHCAGKDQQG